MMEADYANEAGEQISVDMDENSSVLPLNSVVEKIRELLK